LAKLSKSVINYEQVEAIKREISSKGAKLESVLESNVEHEIKQDDIGRIISHCAKVRKTMNVFRGNVLERNIARIEQLIFESFVHLLRKTSLVSDIRIDAFDCSIELRSTNGKVLPPERLSAGEKQLLAVSMIWGLSRASGRPLPVVIDTPLGRLDTDHRSHLVNRYFPYASHQVVLLSTDDEIDEAFSKNIAPWTGHRYRLRFNEELDATVIEDGYFWE